MRVDKVKYTAQYEAGRKVSEWIGIEASPEDGETADEAFKAAQLQVSQWHKENNPPTGMGIELPGGPMNVPITEAPIINVAHERLLILIENAASLDELRGYDGDVDKSGNSKLRDAYIKKFNEINNGN